MLEGSSQALERLLVYVTGVQRWKGEGIVLGAHNVSAFEVAIK